MKKFSVVIGSIALTLALVASVETVQAGGLDDITCFGERERAAKVAVTAAKVLLNTKLLNKDKCDTIECKIDHAIKAGGKSCYLEMKGAIDALKRKWKKRCKGCYPADPKMKGAINAPKRKWKKRCRCKRFQ